jgi:hypothetical protein
MCRASIPKFQFQLQHPAKSKPSRLIPFGHQCCLALAPLVALQSCCQQEL